MQRYLLMRLGQSLLLLFGALVLVFWMVRLTGDPAALLIARDFASPEQLQEMRAALGLNDPLPVQFIRYAGDVLRGDLGYSLRFRQPVRDVIFAALPITLLLSTLAMAIALTVAIPLGVIGGVSPGSWKDSLARLVGLLGQATPTFWLALILIWVFAVNLRWLPSFGVDGLRSFILPAFALSIGAVGQLVRLTRSAVLEIRNEDYIRTARSKGLSPFTIGLHHIARNASIALVSVVGIQFTYLMAGSIYIESIFAIPGIGWMLNEAIRNRDFVLVQSLTLFIATFAVLIHLATDVIYSVLDPRIRHR
ncbi:MAG: ABC transporter permease [Caldilinea sp.]|nr:ABC transporter permease [Caldilinea sp.]MDW8439919.1 ABC transporter permease [Caldilineaceae bacterium]